MSSSEKVDPVFQRDREILFDILNGIKRRSKIIKEVAKTDSSKPDFTKPDPATSSSTPLSSSSTIDCSLLKSSTALRRNFSKIRELHEYVSHVSKRIENLREAVSPLDNNVVLETKEKLIDDKLKSIDEYFLECVEIIERDTGLKTSVITAKCPVCLDIVKDPYATTVCGHLICSNPCMRSLEVHSSANWRDDGIINCPHCRTKTDVVKIYL